MANPPASHQNFPVTPAAPPAQSGAAPARPVSSPPPPPPPAAPGPKVQVKQSPFRFLIPVLLLLILAAGGYFLVTKLFAGRQPSNQPAEEIQLTYWGLWEPGEILTSVIGEFETQNPGIKINYVQQKSTDYRERLQNELAKGQGPDIFRYHHTWVPMLSSSLATLPEDIMSASEYEAAFYPVAARWLKTQKGRVGIPLMIEGLGLFYNKTIMDAAGKTVPVTWEELRRTAKQLTVTQGAQIQRGGVALGTTNNVEHWPDIVGLMLLQNSADPSKPNNNQGQDAINFYTIFSKLDKSWDETMPQSTYAFATEKAVMMVAPSWRAHDIKQINPNLDFAIAPAPTLPDTKVTWASFWAEGVSEKSDAAKQAAAWKFLKYLSEKETLRRFYADASTYRLFGEPFSRIDMADQLMGDKYTGAYIAQAPDAQSWYLASYTHDNGLNDNIIKYYEDAINAVLKGEDAANVLTITEQGIEQVLGRYNLSTRRQ